MNSSRADPRHGPQSIHDMRRLESSSNFPFLLTRCVMSLSLSFLFYKVRETTPTSEGFYEDVKNLT